ncbi:mesencephalic astrocyte-derived neurotrophic factor homolog [Littorina saxatilis]|uniref:Mesencephalic astrocyte-derived neurotrophic factor homolog n=1 Tax=Littorina saxatilis TaxID=31220 RepID=A0AAN9BAA9_9CAEN
MDRKILLLGAATLVLVLLQMIDTVTAKDPRDCEVCISVLDRFLETMPEDERTDQKKLEKKFEKFCKGLKGKDHKICVNLGAVENSPTRILDKMTQPLSWHMPTTKVCQKLKKADAQICDMRYDKQIDLANTNLKKLRVSELKKILSNWGEDNACKGCAEKADFIKEIEKLMPKYDPAAHKKRSEKAEL